MTQFYTWEQIIKTVGLESIMQSKSDLEDKLQFFSKEWNDERHLIWRMLLRDNDVYELDLGYLGYMGQCKGYKDDNIVIEPHKFVIESPGINDSYCHDCQELKKMQVDGMELS